MTSNILHKFGSSNARNALGELGGGEARLTVGHAPEPARYPLARVVAVIGCDGSGKSTLTADLYAQLRDISVTELVYLGQDSGNILRSILRVPLIGPMVGRYLVRKSQNAHAGDKKPAEPDVLTAIVIYLLSRWRRHKFRRMRALHRKGAIIVADRYPQAEVAGFYFDGPGLGGAERASAFVRWLTARERQFYEEMAAYVPGLLIRLNIDAETAHARKPDHKLTMLQDKVSVIPTLAFNAAHILDLDGAAPYPEVLQAALGAARTALKLDSLREAPH